MNKRRPYTMLLVFWLVWLLFETISFQHRVIQSMRVVL